MSAHVVVAYLLGLLTLPVVLFAYLVATTRKDAISSGCLADGHDYLGRFEWSFRAKRWLHRHGRKHRAAMRIWRAERVSGGQQQ